ncbi:MAG: insulinase family protein [Magnetococcales bacterium]|nr:insulinase family protein [Magnetococcales bacterium]
MSSWSIARSGGKERWSARIGLRVVLGLLAFLGTVTLQAAELDYRDFTLENGLQVVLLREKRAPVVVVQVWYRVGSMDEVAGQTGLAHMLEHMMFQGTKSLAPEEFSRIVARNGGTDNASTSQDYTNYYIKLGADQLDLALRMEADRMRNLVLREAKFKSENKVVREERRMRSEATPAARMGERFLATAYQAHPYGRPVIGWMEDISRLSVADLDAFYRRYYAPNNATLVIGGDLEFSEAEQKVRHYFSPLPSDPHLKRQRVAPEPYPATSRRLDFLDAEAKVPLWMAGFLSPTMTDGAAGNDPFALELAGAILGRGLSSRLYRRLVTEDKLAVSVTVDYASLSRDPVFLTFHILLAKGAFPARVEEAVREEVTRLGREPVPERELAKMQNFLIAEHVYERDSVQSLTWDVGRAITSGVDWRQFVIHFPERMRAVTAADVQRVAARYLSSERWVVGVLMPFPTPKPRKVSE